MTTRNVNNDKSSTLYIHKAWNYATSYFYSICKTASHTTSGIKKLILNILSSSVLIMKMTSTEHKTFNTQFHSTWKKAFPLRPWLN